MKKSIVYLLVFISLMGISYAVDEILWSQNGTTDELLLAYDLASYEWECVNFTFNASYGWGPSWLQRFDIYLGTETSNDGSVWVELWDNNNAHPGTMMETGNKVGANKSVLTTALSSNAWNSFNLSARTLVNASTFYWVCMRSDYAQSSGVKWKAVLPSAYGTLASGDGATWATYSGKGTMRIYNSSDASPAGPAATPTATILYPLGSPYRNNTLGQNITVNCSDNGIPYIRFDTINPPVTVVKNATSGNQVSWLTNSSVIPATGLYYFMGNCSNASSVASSIVTFNFDDTKPTITLNSNSGINDSNVTYDKYKNNLFLNFTLTDNYDLYGYNLTIVYLTNGTRYYTDSNLTLTSRKIVNLTRNVDTTGWPSGKYNVTIVVDDSHTETLWDLAGETAIIEKTSSVKFETPEKAAIEIKSAETSTVDTTKLTDRYTFDFSFQDKTVKDRVFYVLAPNQRIDYLANSEYPGHFVVGGLGGNWVDFANDGKYQYSVVPVKDGYEVTIYDTLPTIKFESVGGLNEEFKTWIYNRSTLTLSTPTLSPSSPVIVSTVTGSCLATEGQSDSVAYQWKLYLNSSINQSGNTSFKSSGVAESVATIPSSYLAVGQNWTLECRANSTLSLNYTSRLNSSVATVVSFIVDNCSVATSVALNFTPLNENTLAVMYIDVDAIYNYSLLNSSAVLTQQLLNSTGFKLCVYPAGYNYTLNAYMQYHESNGNGENERYYIENATINNVTQYAYLYNFEDTTGISELKATTYTYYYSYYPDIIGKLQRYYPGENVWRTVQIDKTDEQGQLLFWVYQNSVDYKLLWESGGSRLDVTNPIKFICDAAASCESSFTIQDPTTTNRYSGMDYTYSYDNSTGIIVLSWSDTNNLVSSVNLLVTRMDTAQTRICNTTTTSSSGSIVCNITGYNGLISVKATRTASPGDPFFFTTIEKIIHGLAEALGAAGRTNDGTVFGVLIQTVMVGMGAASGSVVAVIIFAVFGQIINYYLNFASIITYTLTVVLVFVGIVVAYMVRK